MRKKIISAMAVSRFDAHFLSGCTVIDGDDSQSRSLEGMTDLNALV